MSGVRVASVIFTEVTIRNAMSTVRVASAVLVRVSGKETMHSVRVLPAILVIIHRLGIGGTLFGRAVDANAGSTVLVWQAV